MVNFSDHGWSTSAQTGTPEQRDAYNKGNVAVVSLFITFASPPLKVAGGAVSAGISALIAGQDWRGALQRSIVGALWSGLASNQNWVVGKWLAGLAPAWKGAANTAATNLINQSLGAITTGKSFNLPSLAISIGASASFGALFGQVPPGIAGAYPVPSMLGEQVSKGVAGGLASGAVGVTFSF